MKSLCILGKVVVQEVTPDDYMLISKVDSDGYATDVISEQKTNTYPRTRKYVCGTCNREFDGSVGFDECKSHLGKMNEVFMPFTQQPLL